MKTYQDLKNFSQWSDSDKDQFSIAVVKGLVMDATREANSGHPGGPMSCADFAPGTTLACRNGPFPARIPAFRAALPDRSWNLQ